MPEMEVARAFDLLLRVNREARGTPMGVPNFSKELARFVDRQVQKFPKLRARKSTVAASGWKIRMRGPIWPFQSGSPRDI